MHPERKAHAKFASVAALRLNLFAGANQARPGGQRGRSFMDTDTQSCCLQVGDGKIQTPTLGEAVASGLVNNETLAYYMGRTFLYLQRVRSSGGGGPLQCDTCTLAHAFPHHHPLPARAGGHQA